MKFEWDPEKYESNLRKHGIRFEEAMEAFNDQLGMEFIDEIKIDRFIKLVFNFHKGVLVVVFQEIDLGKIRIISARKATKSEKKQYAQRI
jgi:uncharacterized DUF497 family protein